MKQFHPTRLFLIFGTVLSLVCGSFALSQASVRQSIPVLKKPQTAQNTVQSNVQPSALIQQSSATNTAGELIDQGQHRTYYLHTPPQNSTQPLPLVVALHGSGMQGKEMAEKTALSQLADREGFVVVYPDGLKQKWNVSGQEPEDNVAFVHALIHHVQQLHAIDAQRIYVVGLSNGGILAQKLACEAPDQVAAIATVAASLPTQFSSHCQTQKPVSLLMINGTADSVVPWKGGASPDVKVGRNLSIPPIPTVINFWQQHNACPTLATVEQLSSLVEVTDYQSCQADSEVMFVALKGAEHVWTGGGYGQSVYGDTTQRVWQFFQRHSLG